MSASRIKGQPGHSSPKFFKFSSRQAQMKNPINGRRWLNSKAFAFVMCAGLVLALGACGGGGGSNSSSSGAGSGSGSGSSTGSSANSVALTVQAGQQNGVNIPTVSVQICAPGTTVCQTIPNVLVDTGSTGVRIASSALSATVLAALPQETSGSGTLNACEQFVASYTWGTMRTADVTIGPKVAAGQPLQIFGDPAAGAAPVDCSDNGSLPAETTPAQFGSNGVIGVAPALQDCGAACAQQVIPGAYYSCANGNCQGASAPLAAQAQNVVASFAQDNNGVVVSMPAIPAAGQGGATGTLYFGVGTQTDNQMTGATVLATDPATLSETATYNGASFPDSFIDSGSNFFVLNDPSIPACPAGGGFSEFYCPASTLSLTASLAALNGAALSEPFSVGNTQQLFSSNATFSAFDDIAATGALSGSIDFGLPFFYGKQIGVVNEGQSGLGQSGPFFSIGTQ